MIEFENEMPENPEDGILDNRWPACEKLYGSIQEMEQTYLTEHGQIPFEELLKQANFKKQDFVVK